MTTMQYLGFILLGYVIESLTGMLLDVFVLSCSKSDSNHLLIFFKSFSVLLIIIRPFLAKIKTI